MNKSIGVFVPFKMDLGELHNGSILPITPEGATVLDVWCARLKKLNEELGIPVYILTNDLTILGMASLNPPIQIIYWNQENEALTDQTRYKDIAIASQERFYMYINPQCINLDFETLKSYLEEFDNLEHPGTNWHTNQLEDVIIYRFDDIIDCWPWYSTDSKIEINEKKCSKISNNESYESVDKESLTI